MLIMLEHINPGCGYWEIKVYTLTKYYFENH